MTNDQEIAGRIRKGDAEAFESLFRSSYASLVRYAMTLIKDHDTAEEIVQDFFCRLWREREKIRIESSLNGYLYRSVHNKCLHHIEHARVVGRYAEEARHEDQASAESPADILLHRELQAKIAAVIEKLPERCSQIFCMNRFDGMKYSEIAQKLAISVKTVEANMGRALKEFRKELSE